MTEILESYGYENFEIATDAIGSDPLLYYKMQSQGGTNQAPLASATIWTIERRQWEVLELLEEKYQSAFRDDRLLLYLAAVALGRQGCEEDAGASAKRAFQIEVSDAQLRNVFAEIVEELGRHDWAEREWKHVIETVPPIEFPSLHARTRYALLRLHDRGEDEAAAQMLTECLESLAAAPEAQGSLLEDSSRRRILKDIEAQRRFYEACVFEAKGDFQSQRKKLEQAVTHSPEDPDILIALYHLKGVDDAFRKVTQMRIQAVCRKIEFAIETNTGIFEEKDAANYFNHWAWLVSNTEGDYRKALVYSHRSLELLPGNASYLDTLGRCYFSVGDLENAIRYQRQAVKKHPHMQVTQRQLAHFEQHLASRQ